MAVGEHALTTLTRVKTELGISGSGEDSYLEGLIDSVSGRIASFCNRTFQYGEDIEETVPGYAWTALLLSRCPIVEIDSIVLDGSTVSADSYKIKSANAGIVYNETGWAWTALSGGSVAGDRLAGTEDPLYVITYTGGYVTPQQAADDVTLTRNLPYDLEDACVEWITVRYLRKGADPRLQGERLLSWSAQYSVTAQQSTEMPESIAAVLRRYKRHAQGI